MSILSATVLMCMAAINAIIGLTPLVDNWANIGGFLVGFLMGVAFFAVQEQVSQPSCVFGLSLLL